MGIWDVIGSTAESVKRNAPDAATPVKNACKSSYSYGRAAVTNSYSYGSAAVTSSYSYGSAAVTKIDQAARINGLHRLGEWIPDDETRSKIGLYTVKFAKNAGLYALQEGCKLIPGGVALSKIHTNTMNDIKYENFKLEKLKVSKEKLVDTPQKHLSGGGQKFIAGADMHGGGGGESAVSALPATGQSPEDVIRIFMMKEFIGTRYFDHLMVGELARGKRRKPE